MGALGPLPPPLPLLLLMLGKCRAHPWQMPGWRPGAAPSRLEPSDPLGSRSHPWPYSGAQEHRP